MSVELIRVEAGAQSIAVIAYAARRPRGVALVAGHGYSSSKQNLDGLCGFLSSHGFSVYSLDFPGHKLGASGGRLDSLDDLTHAMAATVERARADGFATVYTLGHSMGAMTALIAAAADPSIAGAISIATGLGRPAALGALGGRGTVDLRSSYVDGLTLPEIVDAAEPRVRAAVPALAGRPLLFIAAERDMMVTRASVESLAALASEPVTFVTVPSDHTFAGDNSRSAILAWFGDRHPRAGDRAAAPVAGEAL